MFRILQGDVGSGKTIVSLLSLANVISPYQCALMGPTEILSFQHYNLAKKLFEKVNGEFYQERLNLLKKEFLKLLN